jgi:Dolichyl-phosphate-mannose-protein mannosyltransferase
MRRLVTALLVLVLAAGLGLRLVGIGWGVPREPHFRNYFQDERFVLGLLFRMNPARLDLDPHYYINPTLHYHTLLRTLQAATLLGLELKLPVNEDSHFKPSAMQGETYTALFLIGRLLTVVESLLTILLLFFIGRRLYDEKAGLFAAAMMAVNYACMYQAHFLTTDAPAQFWLVLALCLIVRLRDEPGRRLWQVLAPVGIGLAIGAKYTNLLVLIPYGYVLLTSAAGGDRRLGRAVTGILLVTAAFLVTTPYALLSLPRFLHGDSEGFGGIFGARGLFYYNNFPASLTEPFAATTLTALGIFGTAAFALALIAALARRSRSDVLLLTFIVPFYILAMLKSSPMLRHILPVLPFVFLLIAGTLTAEHNRIARQFGLCPKVRSALAVVLVVVVLLSWAVFSLAAVLRMGRVDTRVQSEHWVRQNVTTERILLPTYFPFRYTPAIDSYNIVGVNYNPAGIEDLQPEYIMMTEPEYRVYGRVDGLAKEKTAFASAVWSSPNYEFLLRFAEPFRLDGITFHPSFPTEDWNFVSPEILVFHRRPAGFRPLR